MAAAEYKSRISGKINSIVSERPDFTALELWDEAILFALEECAAFQKANGGPRKDSGSGGRAPQTFRIPGAGGARFVRDDEDEEEEEVLVPDYTFKEEYERIVADVMTAFAELYGEFTEEAKDICSKQAVVLACYNNVEKSASDYREKKVITNSTSPLPIGPVQGFYTKEMKEVLRKRLPSGDLASLSLEELEQCVTLFICSKGFKALIAIAKRNNYRIDFNNPGYINSMNIIASSCCQAGQNMLRTFTEAAALRCENKARNMLREPFYAWSISEGYLAGNSYLKPDFSSPFDKDEIWKEIEPDILKIQVKNKRAAFQSDIQSEVMVMGCKKALILHDQLKYNGIIPDSEMTARIHEREEYAIREVCAAMMDKFGAMFTILPAKLCFDHFKVQMKSLSEAREYVFHYYDDYINPNA